METMYIYLKENVNFQAIKHCLDSSPDTTVIMTSPILDKEELIIHYDVESQPTYMRWSKLEGGIKEFDESNAKRINDHNNQFKVFYYIRYRFYTIPEIIPILKRVLDCYNGVIDCEGEFFNLANIDKMRDLKLPNYNE
jgi:hypothetical protein